MFKPRLHGLLLLVTVAACSRSVRPGGGDGGEPGDLAATPPGPDGGAMAVEARLQGRVLAPEGTIPIAGALIFASATPPPPIPNGVYCDKCVHLTVGTPYTRSAADGSFELPLTAGPTHLVVQKGAFRRVRRIDVQPGPQALPKELTTLPAITDAKSGDDVPRIAVVLGAWDPIEIVLARLGLRATITKDAFGRAQLLAKDAPAFAIYGLHFFGETSPYPAPTVLLRDPKEIAKYQIVFLPCAGSPSFDGDPKCGGVYDSDPKVRSTLEGFVKAGGRLYVSDWSYEYVRQVFGGFVSWKGQSATIGSACMNGGGDQTVTRTDPGLADWLAAQAQKLSVVKDAWTNLTSVQARQGLDADGKPALITPRVWVEAGAPTTTSFRHGCGRVLFSTYHTQPTKDGNATLEPQALSMLYLILEVGVCIDELIPG